MSVVPATTETGEVTAAPFAGEQIVTEGEVGFSAHWAAEVPASSSNAIRFRAAVSSRVLGLKQLLLVQLTIPAVWSDREALEATTRTLM